MIKFSAITTVLNEAGSIGPLLDSLAKQIMTPGEIIITDAGSMDGTVEKIRAWQKKHPEMKITLLGVPGVNRSVGRNKAIEAAKNEHIAVIDAGCRADKGWLMNLAQEFERTGAETVAGFYRTRPKTSLQQIYGLYLAVQPDQFDSKTYLPSSRSLAMTKAAFSKAGRYPIKLNTCEDLVFAAKLKAKTVMTVTDKAWVEWQLPVTIGEYLRTVAGYAQGDVEAKYRPHLIKILSVFGRYGLFLVAPWLFLLYLLYPQFKFIKRLQLPTLLLTSVIQVLTDAAVMWGGLKGVFTLVRRA